MESKIDYSGKKVFVGIDVHSKTLSVCVICDAQIVAKAAMAASKEALIAYLDRFIGATVSSAYEAGYFGFCLHRALVAHGIANIVINPASIEVAANDRVKTDKRDAKKLAELLSAGRLKAIRVPTEEEEQRRALTRTREQLGREKKRVVNQIRAKIAYYGIQLPDAPKHLGKKFLTRLLALPLPEDIQTAFRALATIWESLNQEIKNIEKKIIEQSKQDEQKERIYRSAPGIGPLSARILANELGDMQQFKNERSLFCFSGLTPSEHSSGEKTVRGHITRQGASRLRCILVESAWKAIKLDPALNGIYTTLSLRRGKQRAIVATARHLVGRLRACFRKGETWKLGLQLKLASVQA